MDMEAQTLGSLRRLVRELQDENSKLKEQLKKANIIFPEKNVFEEKIEDLGEYDPDQGERIIKCFITEEMARRYFAMFWGRTDVYASCPFLLTILSSSVKIRIYIYILME